jgi:hypothetical protein
MQLLQGWKTFIAIGDGICLPFPQTWKDRKEQAKRAGL